MQQETDTQAGHAGNVHRQSQRIAWRQIRLLEDRLSGHALELARFQNKVEKERPKQVSPRQHLGDSSQPTFAQNGQKNYYFTHSLCHSLMVGCHSFAPFGGASLRHPIPRALPGAGISMPHSGRREPNVQADMLSA